MGGSFYGTPGVPALEEWSCRFPPASVTLRDLKTGREIREPSLVAAQVKRTAGSRFPAEIQRYLAAGKAARTCVSGPDVMVFSPLRRGQVAYYTGTVYLLQALLRQLRPWPVKPVLWLQAQTQTTEVERTALFEAGIQAGARKVFLYQEPFLFQEKSGLLLTIEPQEKPEELSV